MPQQYKNATKKLNEILSTSQNKSYFVGAVTVVFIVIMAMVGIIPAYSAFTFQNEENGKRDVLIEKLRKKLKTSQTLSEEYTNKSSLVDYFNKSFPASAEQQDIIDTINAIISNNGAQLNRITFNNTPSPGFAQNEYDNQVGAQTVSITVEGSQGGLLSVVSDLENNRRILNILTLTMDRKAQEIIDAGEAFNKEYVLNVNMEYYFFSKQ